MDCSTPGSSLLLPPRVCSNSCPLSQWCHSTVSSSIAPISFCLQSFPPLGTFPMSGFFAHKSLGLLSCSVMSDSLWPHGLQPARLFCPWNPSSKNTGVGHHILLQGILLTQGLNPPLLYCMHILYQPSYWGSLECVPKHGYRAHFSW